MTNTTNDELKTFYSTFLIKEIRDKVQMLREYGMNEAEIISKLFQSPSFPQLFISRNYRIFLGEEHKEVHLEPLVKAVFLLFLKHPEGINFKDLPDYREELTKYYTATAKGADRDKIIEGVDHLVNPLDNAINEKCSRIKKTFLDMMDEYTASYYIISSHTQKHFEGSTRIWYERLKIITLPRELVISTARWG